MMSRIVTRKLAMEEARAHKLKVIKGDRHTLLLDLDTDEDERHYTEMLPIVCQHLKLEEKKRWQSRNGGLHVKLYSKRGLSTASRLLIQACLGSDRVKEFLSLVRVWKGERDPVLLFKPPKQKTVRYSPYYLEEFPADITDDDVPF